MLAGMALGAAIAPLLVETFSPRGAYAAVGATLIVLSLIGVPALLSLDATAVYRPRLTELLRGIDFLAVLDVPTLERLARGAHEISLDAGCDVVRQGDFGDQFYVVDEGYVIVTVDGHTLAAPLGPGSGFGEIALLRQVPRTATVRTQTPSRLWQIDRDLFIATVSNSSAQDIAERRVDAHLRRVPPGDSP